MLNCGDNTAETGDNGPDEDFAAVVSSCSFSGGLLSSGCSSMACGGVNNNSS